MKQTLLFLFLITSILSVKAQELVKPNVIIFYADDLGWQDTPLNKIGDPSPWETPNMEKLAAAGAMFTQAYAPAPTCAPSRAALLTGRHPVKTTLIQVSGGKAPGLERNKTDRKLIGAFNPERMQEEEFTLAEALNPAGYVSAHIGKWHIAGANGFPEAIHQGFDEQSVSRGVHRNMGNRFEGYATDAADDPYKIGADGKPFDSLTEDALAFMDKNKSQPFFLYMATYLVHTPIQTRDLALLTHYCNKLGIEVPTEDTDITTGGHSNPYYGAMVSTLDWSLGKVIDYLENTEDPRNPGKTLFETTYILFSSDNGASENDGAEIVTDNFPLDLGKTSSKEGGIRVPLVITGPDIPVNVFDNVVNGLDFFPTILSLTGTTVDDAIFDDLDGVDLTPLLKEETTIVKDVNGAERTDLIWHYPNANDDKSKSAIRRGNYKLYKKYIDSSYEAFQLYNDDGSFNDLEEMIDIIDMMDQSLKEDMIATLETYLTDNNAKLPTWNPLYDGPDAPLPNQEKVPSVISTNYDQVKQIVTATISTESNQAVVSSGILLYKEEGAKEEWHESLSKIRIEGNMVTANVPETAIAVVFNLADENNFLVSSKEIEIAFVNQITLNDLDTEQLFNPGTDHSELIGGTTINGNGSFLQTRTEGGGDGAKFVVRSAEKTTIVCDSITVGIRSQAEDVVTFDVTIAGETQSFDYTSTRSADDVEFNFTTPVTFTNTGQEIEIVTTALTNSGGLAPRFRIYDLTFHVGETLVGIEDLEDNRPTLNLFPNPVHDIFNLSEEVESGILYNLYGAKTYQFNNKYQNIDISSMETGLYFLHVISKNGQEQTLKLLKQ